MKTKEELIREAYGPDYDALKPHINMETGRCNAKPTEYHLKRAILQRYSTDGDFWWPRGLRRDLKNNGWMDIRTTELVTGQYYEFISNNNKHTILRVTESSRPHLRKTCMLVKQIIPSSLPIYVP